MTMATMPGTVPRVPMTLLVRLTMSILAEASSLATVAVLKWGQFLAMSAFWPSLSQSSSREPGSKAPETWPECWKV